VHVVGRDPAPQQPHHREADQVGPGEHEHPAAGGAEPGDGGVEDLGQRVGVTAGADDVVSAGRERHQARRQGDGGGHLLGHDLPDQLAPDREVGVLKSRVLGSDQPGQPVGPAAIPAAGRRVVETFGEAVANRHKGRFPRGLRK